MGKLLESEATYLYLIFSDLKPNNIVLTDSGEVRLIDFGHSRRLNKETLQVLPPQHANQAAPDVWKGKPAGLSSDWWTYG